MAGRRIVVQRRDRRGSGVSRVPSDPLVLIFGESKNDSDSLRYLAAALNQRLTLSRLRAQPRPTSLQRTARLPAVRRWVDDIGRVVRGVEATGRTVAAILVHRDADGPDPDGEVHRRLTEQIAPIARSCAVVPVEELEAWWFLFPDAVESVRPRAWRGKIERHSRDVEMISNPKEELVRLTRGVKSPPYAESDSVQIAQAIFERRLSPVGACRSYERFRAAVGAIA